MKNSCQHLRPSPGIGKWTAILTLATVAFFSNCAGDEPIPTPTPSPKNPTGTGSNTGTTTPSPPTVTAPETLFISNQCYSMNNLGAWWTQKFTLGSSTKLVVRFSSRNKADAGIFTEDQLVNFQTNKTFSGYGLFDDKFGYRTITLAAGSYYAGMRNQTEGANEVSLEIDYDITLPASDRATFTDVYIKAAESLNAGGKLWHEFTIQKGYRYFVDGNNTGLDSFIMPQTEIEKFKSGQAFNAYTAYSSSGCEAPGLYEVKLPEGTYFLTFRNSQSVSNSVNYFMERWSVK